MSRMQRPLPRLLAALIVSVWLCACAVRAPYERGHLDETAAPRAYTQRTTESPGLGEFVRASGYDGVWPPLEWDLDTLTLLALYFNSEIDVARAEAVAAQAALTVAAQRSPLSIDLAVENHGREVEGDGPWSLGVAVNLPLKPGNLREARIDKASLSVDVAELEIAAAAWRARSAVRDALIELRAADWTIEQVLRQITVRNRLLGLVQRRVEAGMLSSRDAGSEQVALSMVEAELGIEKTRQAQALGKLSRALGLPVETVRSLRIADHAIREAQDIVSSEQARARALRNRIDVHQRLLEYGVADAEYKLAVAAQYPEIILSPGYLWDQGDSVWSLVTSFAVPPAVRAKVYEARARRDLAAQRFLALQLDVVGEVEQARESVEAANLQIRVAAAAGDQAQTQHARVRRHFDSGGSDRLELMMSELSVAQAERHSLQARLAWLRAIADFEDATQAPARGSMFEFTRQSRATGTQQ